MKERFCGYCNNFKLDAGFRTVHHLKTTTRRGMCLTCQERRKTPHAELIALAEKEKSERKKK